MNYFDIIINWIIDNWQLVLIVGSGVIECVLIFIFKKSKFYDPSIMSRLVDLVLDAEEKFGSGHGKEKLSYVLECFYASNNNSIPPVFIKSLVEKILSTPKKKGGN